MNSKFNISSQELAEALEITHERLYEICAFFDSDPGDKWGLNEGEHFEWGICKSRKFSPEGAVKICSYLEQNQKERPFFKRFRRWALRQDRRLKELMVLKKVQEIGDIDGHLVFVDNKAFLGPRACREILGLGTRQDILNRTFIEIQRCENTEIEPLQISVDFFEDNGSDRYLSRSGIASVGKQLGSQLSNKHRKEWLKVVSNFAPKALKAIEDDRIKKENNISKVMKQVRNDAGGRCQLTGRLQSAELFNLEVHHIYDRKTYPVLADCKENMIAIAGDVHKDFHKWMGGPHISCTLEDFERYIEIHRTSFFPSGKDEQAANIIIRLSNTKKILGGVAKVA